REAGLAARILGSPRHQVVLDAPARHGSHQDAVLAERAERAGRPRARAEGLRHGEQPDAPTRDLPVAGAFDDVEVEALHGWNIPRLTPGAGRSVIVRTRHLHPPDTFLRLLVRLSAAAVLPLLGAGAWAFNPPAELVITTDDNYPPYLFRS